VYSVRLSEDGSSLEGDIEALFRALEDPASAVSLTGAGISVESGIPDFRSPGGLWSVFHPGDYATLTCFLNNPAKAWELYRALGKTLIGKRPNAAHDSLARLESVGFLGWVITQNVDGLHQAAGNRNVLEVHGEHGHLHCIGCGHLEPFLEAHLEDGPVPRCPSCNHPLKPNVVLFEEQPRELDRIASMLTGCDLMLVIGTSAQVAPACLFPRSVLDRGGSILEFNLEPTELTRTGLGPLGVFVRGPAGSTLPLVAELALGRSTGWDPT
jgi:NAD-dependent deacetylase